MRAAFTTQKPARTPRPVSGARLYWPCVYLSGGSAARQLASWALDLTWAVGFLEVPRRNRGPLAVLTMGTACMWAAGESHAPSPRLCPGSAGILRAPAEGTCCTRSRGLASGQQRTAMAVWRPQ